MSRRFSLRHLPIASAAIALLLCPALSLHAQDSSVLTGQDAFTNYAKEKPGVTRKLTVADLPAPYATKGVDNGADMVKRPEGAIPQAPEGFKVSLYYTGLNQPRLIRKAPNGDLFVALSYENKVMVFRGVDSEGKAKEVSTFADNLSQPFGIAFYPAGPNPKWIYIGNTDAVVRFPYKNGDLKATGPVQKLADLPGGG
jgi:glucose/arabinose dehydrogenase